MASWLHWRYHWWNCSLKVAPRCYSLFLTNLLWSSGWYICTTFSTTPSKMAAQGNMWWELNQSLQELIPFLTKMALSAASSSDSKISFFLIQKSAPTCRTWQPHPLGWQVQCNLDKTWWYPQHQPSSSWFWHYFQVRAYMFSCVCKTWFVLWKQCNKCSRGYLLTIFVMCEWLQIV